MKWSDHLTEMTEELERIEQHARPDDIHVTTRNDSTSVTLIYEHSVGDDDE